LLQGHVKSAGVTAVRFVTNSTVGLLGTIDVAKHMGAVHHDNDFGLTLGRLDFKPGPYLFIPLVGPSTVRDIIGDVFDTAADPFHWVNYPQQVPLSVTDTVVGGLDLRSRSDDELKALLSDATDPYATLRSVYLQNREGEVEGGENKGNLINTLPDFGDQPGGAPAPATPPPSTPSPHPESVAPPPPAVSVPQQ
jgi:phospholipid-binding lipoprotein MlaA